MQIKKMRPFGGGVRSGDVVCHAGTYPRAHRPCPIPEAMPHNPSPPHLRPYKSVSRRAIPWGRSYALCDAPPLPPPLRRRLHGLKRAGTANFTRRYIPTWIKWKKPLKKKLIFLYAVPTFKIGRESQLIKVMWLSILKDVFSDISVFYFLSRSDRRSTQEPKA